MFNVNKKTYLMEMSGANPLKLDMNLSVTTLKLKSYYHDASFYQNCEARYPMQLEIR